MTANPLQIVPGGKGQEPPDPVALLLDSLRSDQTRRAYAADCQRFFGENYSRASVLDFLSEPRERVLARLLTYKGELIKRGLSEASVNRYLGTICNLLTFAHRLNLSACDGRDLIQFEKVKPYRDTRGVSLTVMQQLLALPGTADVRGKRDTALLRLLFATGLRAGEVCRLSVPDLDEENARLRIRGKGRGTQTQWIDLPPGTLAALVDYLTAAGHRRGGKGTPLFRNLSHRPKHRGKRLTTDGLRYLCGLYGRRVGVSLTPHKLRHTSITQAIEATQGNLALVQDHSRHADTRTVQVYNDGRGNGQKLISTLLDQRLG